MAGLGVVEQDLELLEIGFQPHPTQFVANKNSRLVISRGAGNVRFGGQNAQPTPRIFRRRHGQREGLGLELRRT